MRRSLPQITQIYTDIGYGEKDTNHTDVAQEKSVTIRDICGKTFSRNICDNPWNLWETFSSSVRRSLPQITQIYTDIGCGGEGHESHGRSTRKICDNPWNLWDNILSRNRNICDNPWNLWDNILSSSVQRASHRLRRFTRILGTGRRTQITRM